jgi:hypothetical protein
LLSCNAVGVGEEVVGLAGEAFEGGDAGCAVGDGCAAELALFAGVVAEEVSGAEFTVADGWVQIACEAGKT